MNQVCPRDAASLCALAAFLRDQRRDLDEAEKYFRMGVESAPYDADALCDLAHFLTEERRDVDGADALLQLAVEAQVTSLFCPEPNPCKQAAESQASPVSRHHTPAVERHAKFRWPTSKSWDIPPF